MATKKDQGAPSQCKAQKMVPAVRGAAVVVLLAAAGCAHPWRPVLREMDAERVVAELAGPERDFNAKAPRSVAPSPANEWIVFIYDPEDASDAHAAFASFEKDCFFETVQYEGEDDDAPRPRHAAVCVRERTPKPP